MELIVNLLVGVLLLLSLLSFLIAYSIWTSNRHVWERNRKITHLIRKYHEGSHKQRRTGQARYVYS